MQLPGVPAIWQPSVAVPQQSIVGTAGAGDALAAGVLYGWHERWSPADSLRLGVCAAAASLGHAACSEGVRPAGACLELGRAWGSSGGNG
jgi:sugar/nucleoside kinase (ribokinase family)